MTQIKVEQAASILEILQRWCDAQPGRRIIIGKTEHGWKAALENHLPSRGESLIDCLSQVATVAAMGTSDS